MNPNTPRPHCTIHLDLIDVAHMNLLDYFDRDQWDQIECTTADGFIDLIGPEILAFSAAQQREPQEVLAAAETAIAMLRASLTGTPPGHEAKRQLPEGEILDAGEILAALRSRNQPAAALTAAVA